MSEIIKFLLEYPAWVKIAVPLLVLAIVIILLFFHPASAASTGDPSAAQKPTPAPTQHQVGSGDKENEQTEINALVILLNTRADLIVSTLDDAMRALDAASPGDTDKAKLLRDQLETLKRQFIALHKRHIDAIQKNDILLSHEINNEIHDVLAKMADLVDTRVGEISRNWFGKLPHQYLNTPEPGIDPTYDAVLKDTAKLHEDTVDRLRSATYPGKLPESTSMEISNLVFGIVDQNKPKGETH